MWNNLSRILFVIALAAAGAAAWLYFGQVAELQAALEQSEDRVRRLTDENRRYQEHTAYLTQRLEEDIAKVSKEKEEELARLAHTHDDMVKSLQQEIQAGQVTITRIADRLSVNLVDKILFPTGEAEVTKEGRKVLERVGQVLAQARDKTIRIEGHTDAVPISRQLKDQFPTNWELSAARAINVVRFLQESTDIDPAAFEAVGMGEYHPVADNKTAVGRGQNRRIEIILYPRVQSVVKDLPAASAAKSGPSVRP